MPAVFAVAVNCASEYTPRAFPLQGYGWEAAMAYLNGLRSDLAVARKRGDARYWLIADWDDSQVLLIDPRQVTRLSLEPAR